MAKRSATPKKKERMEKANTKSGEKSGKRRERETED